jgi:DNA repair protein RadC
MYNIRKDCIVGFVEEFDVLLLDYRNRVLGISNIHLNSQGKDIIDPDRLFSIALKSTARKVVLAHNHPDNKFQPKQREIAFYRRMERAGKLFNIEIMDYRIITPKNHISLKNK